MTGISNNSNDAFSDPLKFKAEDLQQEKNGSPTLLQLPAEILQHIATLVAEDKDPSKAAKNAVLFSEVCVLTYLISKDNQIHGKLKMEESLMKEVKNLVQSCMTQPNCSTDVLKDKIKVFFNTSMKALKSCGSAVHMDYVKKVSAVIANECDIPILEDEDVVEADMTKGTFLLDEFRQQVCDDSIDDYAKTPLKLMTIDNFIEKIEILSSLFPHNKKEMRTHFEKRLHAKIIENHPLEDFAQTINNLSLEPATENTAELDQFYRWLRVCR